MERIEWVVKDSVFWNNTGISSSRPSTLMTVDPESVMNTRIAYVLQPKLGVYEAILIRANHGTWTLGEFDNIQEAKDAVIAALTIERLEQ